MRTLLLGGTDLTQAVAERIRSSGLVLAGVVYVPQEFDISYEPARLQSSRYADLATWCAAAGVPARIYDGPASISTHAQHCGADFALAAGWYHMVPRSVRQHFSRGCAGLHGSLLPKYRGGAPLAWAILAGETETGMSLFELGDGTDDGGLYGQRAFPIGPRTRVGELVAAAEAAAIDLVGECLPGIAAGTIAPALQRGTPSYGLQRAPRDGKIDWSQPAERIDRLVRAVSRPYPGAFTSFNDTTVHIWSTDPFEGLSIHGTPGQIAMIPDEIDPCVVTGHGALVVREATGPGGSSMLPLLRRAGSRRFTS